MSEDFLADESFIRYCKGEPAAVTQWENYIRQHPDQTLSIAAARKFYLDLFTTMALADRDEQEARLMSRLYQETVPVIPIQPVAGHKTRSILKLLSIGIAASLLLAVGLWFYEHQQAESGQPDKFFQANIGERKYFQLPDGSMVLLNAGSQIRIPATYGMESRDIYLDGEAFFDVKHHDNQPFIVHTAAMDVKALGTAFNVKAYPGETKTETALVRGKVEVTLKHDNDRKIILHPNEKIRWENDDPIPATANAVKDPATFNPPTGSSRVVPIAKTEFGDLKETAWTENKLVFENDELEEIAIQLERWYGIRVEFGDDSSRHYRFTGTFERESLKMVLEILKESRAFHYTLETGPTTTVKIVQ